jgi:hypothetical protein
MASADVLDIHFIAGNRSELDLKFKAVVATEKSPDETMSDFIKRSVIERFGTGQNQQQESLAAEKVRQELLARIQELEEKIQTGYTSRENFVSQPKTVKQNDKISKLSAAW